jgi:hypothetical protein
MKQQKVDELTEKARLKQELIEQNTAALSDPEELLESAIDEIQDSDTEVQGLKNKFKKENNVTEEAADQVREFAKQRLIDRAQKAGKDPQTFAQEYLTDKINSDKKYVDVATKHIEQINNAPIETIAPKGKFDKGNWKRSPSGNPEESAKRMKDFLHLITPNKYKVRDKFLTPEEQGDPKNVERTFRPLDHVKKYKQVGKAIAQSINLTEKVASAMDKLSAIKARLAELSLPTAYVDDMIDGVEADYEKQMVVVARRLYVRRDSERSANKERRRMWSLL